MEYYITGNKNANVHIEAYPQIYPGDNAIRMLRISILDSIETFE